MGFIEEYKELVVISSPSVNEYVDKFSLYDHYGLEQEEGVYIGKDITDYLYKKISETLECKNDSELSPYLLRKISNHLLLEHLFEGGSLIPYYVLEVIIDATRSKCIVSFDEAEKWKEAITAAMDFNIISESPFYRSSSSWRLFNLANAAKYFKNKGYEVKIRDAEVKIDEEDLKKIGNEIEDQIRLLGGMTVIDKMLNDMSRYFNDELKRFFFNRNMGYGEESLIPVGYILNLAAKYPYSTQIEYTEMWEYYYKYLIQISRNLAAIYNVQPYNNIELLFIKPLPEFVRETAIFDRLFTLVQLKPSEVNRILSGLFSSIDQNEMENELGFNLSHLIEVTNRIFDLAENDFQPLIFGLDNLKYDEEILIKVLDVLSEDVNTINEDFLMPTDQTNFIFKPLIKVESKYILLNKSWRAPTFYEALFIKLINSNMPDFDLGIELENFIKSEFERNNITSKSGHYNMGGIQGDCDIVIESNDFILLIELKKKSLTRAAQSGDDIKLIIDLSKSLLHAQLQAGKHELLLLEKGYIEFDDGTRLELNNRFIERFAITLLDYGGFQYRNVINQMLRQMSTKTFGVRIREYESEFEEIKKKTDELTEQSKKLAVYDSSFNKFPFFNCWFISLPQLLMLIDDSSDNESFMQLLKKNRHILFNSLDFYFDYWKLNHSN